MGLCLSSCAGIVLLWFPGLLSSRRFLVCLYPGFVICQIFGQVGGLDLGYHSCVPGATSASIASFSSSLCRYKTDMTGFVEDTQLALVGFPAAVFVYRVVGVKDLGERAR